MSVAREKIGSLVDHQKSREIQEEINKKQRMYGGINKKTLEEMGYTHETIGEFYEDMNIVIGRECGNEGCKHEQEHHEKILTQRSLLWKCAVKDSTEWYMLHINRL